MAILGQNYPFKGELSQLFYEGLLDVYCTNFIRNFMPYLSRYKLKWVHFTRYKTPTFSPPFCFSLAQGVKILTC